VPGRLGQAAGAESVSRRRGVSNLLAQRSAATPAVEARLSEKAATGLYDWNIVLSQIHNNCVQ
jgi:hypothetical protein